MEGRLYYVNQINDLLTWMATRISSGSQDNRQDMNVVAETTMCGLLNRMYGWNLVNANTRKQNFPGVDLADEDACIAVQVTSKNTVAKVRNTMDTFFEKKLDKRFNRVIVLVMTHNDPTVGMKKVQYGSFFTGDKDIWNFQYLLKDLKERDVSAIQQIHEYLKIETGIGSAVCQPSHLLPSVPALSLSFVEGSRDRELTELKKMVSPDAPIFLWGVGGIGKTQLAYLLANQIAPEGAYLLFYYDMPGKGDALRETILRATFTGYRYQGEDTENRDYEFRERMDILRTEYRGVVLVIDNFDRTGRTLAQLQAEKTYQELTAMGIQLIFTTRNQVNERGYHIEPLGEENLLQLMRSNLGSVKMPEDELRQLIREVGGHTLMVILMARTLANSNHRLRPATILNALKNGKINSRSFLKVGHTHHSEHLQARIYEHMKSLFALSDMTDMEKGVLRCATLLPEDGMDAGLFQYCLMSTMLDRWLGEMEEEIVEALQEWDAERQDTMNFLVARGWLEKDEQNLLTIHPVIREVCREELKPTQKHCMEFLDRLEGVLWWRKGKHPDKEFYENCHPDILLQIAKCISIAVDKLENGISRYGQTAVECWSFLRGTKDSLLKEIEYKQKMLEIMEQESPRYGRLYYEYCNDLEEFYGSRCEYHKELEYVLKKITYLEKRLPPNLQRLISHYLRCARIYMRIDDYPMALKYAEKVLALRSRNSYAKEIKERIEEMQSK